MRSLRESYWNCLSGNGHADIFYILWYEKFKLTEDKSQKEVEDIDTGDIKELKKTADNKGIIPNSG